MTYEPANKDVERRFDMSPAELMVRINASVGFVVRAHKRETAKVAGVCGLRFQRTLP